MEKEITVKLSEEAYSIIQHAAKERNIDASRMIQIILYEWTIKEEYMKQNS